MRSIHKFPKISCITNLSERVYAVHNWNIQQCSGAHSVVLDMMKSKKKKIKKMKKRKQIHTSHTQEGTGHGQEPSGQVEGEERDGKWREHKKMWGT
jgi:hypothetical protein